MGVQWPPSFHQDLETPQTTTQDSDFKSPVWSMEVHNLSKTLQKSPQTPQDESASSTFQLT